MPDSQFHTHALQSLRVGIALHIGAGHFESHVVQYFGDTAHTDTTNADEVNVLDAVTHTSPPDKPG